MVFQCEKANKRTRKSLCSLARLRIKASYSHCWTSQQWHTSPVRCARRVVVVQTICRPVRASQTVSCIPFPRLGRTLLPPAPLRFAAKRLLNSCQPLLESPADNSTCPFRFSREIRTPDLCIANAALSQLSYRPRGAFDFSACREECPAHRPNGRADSNASSAVIASSSREMAAARRQSRRRRRIADRRWQSEQRPLRRDL